jgi:hypothetical protein
MLFPIGQRSKAGEDTKEGRRGTSTIWTLPLRGFTKTAKPADESAKVLQVSSHAPMVKRREVESHLVERDEPIPDRILPGRVHRRK